MVRHRNEAIIGLGVSVVSSVALGVTKKSAENFVTF
jgi:hypothetical protein